jgi:hypothetical protein
MHEFRDTTRYPTRPGPLLGLFQAPPVETVALGICVPAAELAPCTKDARSTSHLSKASRVLFGHLSTHVVGWALSTAGAFVLLAGCLSQPQVGDMPPARLAQRGERVGRIISIRVQPNQSPPHLTLKHTVSDDDLLTVLAGAAPVWTPPTVSCLIHELKLWGKDADFSASALGRSVTGLSIVETLLSDPLCRTNASPNGAAYLLDSPYGIRVVELGTSDSVANRGEAHFGQLLKALAEGRVPSTCAVTTSSGRTGTIEDLFQDATLRFSPSRELEFIACAIAYWLPDGQRTWIDEFGNQHSFDNLMRYLLAIPYGKGSCAGCHVPYAIATILARNDHAAIASLAPNTRTDAVDFLRRLSRHLERCQSPSGAWDKTWGTESITFASGDAALDRITVTGHHLEWMAIAPPNTLPPDNVIVRAVASLRSDVTDVIKIPGRSYKTLLPTCHAARALCLIRGVDPNSIFQDALSSGKITMETMHPVE